MELQKVVKGILRCFEVISRVSASLRRGYSRGKCGRRIIRLIALFGNCKVLFNDDALSATN